MSSIVSIILRGFGIISIVLAILTGCTTPQQSDTAPIESARPMVNLPTQTLTATSSKTLTAKPVFTSTPDLNPPTPKLITPPPEAGQVNSQSMVSPNGEWMAQASFETLQDGYRVQLKVFAVDETANWTVIDYKADGLGYNYPQLKHWSQDSRYFFFVDREMKDGCGQFYDVDSMWKRVDTKTGLVTDYPLPTGRSHSLSPDEAILAYVGADPPLRLILHDMLVQQERELPLPIGVSETPKSQAGDIVWSPDGASVVLAIASDEICGSTRLAFSLVRVNISTLQVSILANSTKWLRPVEWRAVARILVRDWDGYSWWINADDGEITSSPDGLQLSVDVSPLEGAAPLSVNVSAILAGGPENSYDIYQLVCTGMSWDFGDGTVGVVEVPPCEPWTAEFRAPRRFSTEHIFERAGSYKVYFELGEGEQRLKSNVVTVIVR